MSGVAKITWSRKKMHGVAWSLKKMHGVAGSRKKCMESQGVAKKYKELQGVGMESGSEKPLASTHSKNKFMYPIINICAQMNIGQNYSLKVFSSTL